MKIIIEPHTLKRASERGASESEIFDVINNGLEITARFNRLAKVKIYEYNKQWNNNFYKQKRIEVIYTKEDDNIVTITVYVFYGEWE
ncbi:MAG: hypothetical protein A2X61_15295 [Ignavibacteria bacterium GWB2_35_12]|nr:MAG: hypothetical protein A2X61_15295 [Ignavibacteria bacterium GWB2_35_12]OGU90460.1 MAG: hypothetical protein A2220_12745 [Ignavibacteria bacterium RIFOXYA2_FULL_35_10]OGV20586.1 MAG: hypothetical protein A2475_00295 [Ignavibacteria bacterium RIFOXYC2_FULL_35_21]